MLLGVNLGEVRTQIRKARKARGWSLDDLAEKSGVNRSTIHDIETNGDGRPAFETIGKLIEGLGFTLAAFFARLEGVEAPAPQRDEPPRDDSVEAVATRFADVVVRQFEARLTPVALSSPDATPRPEVEQLRQRLAPQTARARSAPKERGRQKTASGKR